MSNGGRDGEMEDGGSLKCRDGEKGGRIGKKMVSRKNEEKNGWRAETKEKRKEPRVKD